MSFKKISALLLTAAFALTVTAGCKKKEEAPKAEAPKAAADTIKIGFLGALTGDTLPCSANRPWKG
ncbi:MAG: hypothetical protein PHF56_23615 [Desulfuromonadaceae bacterium]|nr:hypothetical protein [Desulfuromonadaceae bacterium]